ncbi:MAG: YkvA family protein [Halioglobus sp.]
MSDDNRFEVAYSESNFWDKLKRYAKAAGAEVVERALLLYYAAQEEKAPAWAKGTIAAALGYFIVPLDAITDLAPAVGYADDLGVLVLAIAAVSRYINDDVREKTRRRMQSWFGEETPGEEPTTHKVGKDAD